MSVSKVQKPLSIKTASFTATTDSYGQIQIPQKYYQGATLISVWADDYRYCGIKQGGGTVRIFNTSMALVTNTAVAMVVVYA